MATYFALAGEARWLGKRLVRSDPPARSVAPGRLGRGGGVMFAPATEGKQSGRCGPNTGLLATHLGRIFQLRLSTKVLKLQQKN